MRLLVRPSLHAFPDGPSTPINARYASPINWAAIRAKERGISGSGVVVEVHNAKGNRASFSNECGDISCPGADVFSSVAFDPTGNPSMATNARMSGTSMASPYRAAGHALFRLVRPEYSGLEAADCIRKSSEQSSSSVPMLKLAQALRCSEHH